MKSITRSLGLFPTLLWAIWCVLMPTLPAAAQAALPGKSGHSLTKYFQAPLSFEPAASASGQDEYVSHGLGYSLRLQPGGVRFALSSGKGQTAEVHMGLLGARLPATLRGLEPSGAVSHYFVGNDPSRWRTGVRNYSKVQYSGVYPGIDLVFYGNQRQLEYDFVVAPGADPEAIRLQLRDARSLRLSPEGDLLIGASTGELKLLRPQVYQEDGHGGRQAVRGAFVLGRHHEVSFRLGEYDRRRTLTIDPVVNFSTYLGGSGNDMDSGNPNTLAPSAGIALDADGNVYVIGATQSTDFPLVGSVQNSLLGSTLGIFISKFDPTGSNLLFSTYLGGSQENFGQGIAVDSSGNIYVAGGTTSNDFPTTKGAFQTTAPGASNSFVTKISPTGDNLIYSTYVGGNTVTSASTMALDSAGHVFLTGAVTGSLPVTQGAFQTMILGGRSAFVAEVAADGASLVYCTYLGGSTDDIGRGIALDASGNAYVTGFTRSTDFPTLNAYQAQNKGAYNAFLTKLNPTGTALVYSTYLGGSNLDQGWAVAVDSAGSAYVTGYTQSTDFPTVNPMQAVLKGSSDVFITKMAPDGSAPEYSTYLGGTMSDQAYAIAVDAAGDAYVTGITGSTFASGLFPTLYPIVPSNIGQSSEAFITEMNPTGSAFVYSTWFSTINGSGIFGQAITVDAKGNVYVLGTTTANDMIVTPGAYQSTLKGFSDAFVVKVAPLSLSATKLNFGNVTVGTTSPSMSALLIDSGFQSFNIQQIDLGGTNPSDFAQTNTCGSQILEQTNCTISATFTPSAEGPFSATVSITDDAGPVAQVITLTGTGVAPTGPLAVLAPSNVLFGNQAQGTTSAPQTIVLSNNGTATLNISSIAITGVDASAFQLSNGCGATLAAGASCNLSVTFAPGSVASFAATLTVTDDATGSPQIAMLSGVGTQAPTPQAVLTPSSLGFGNQSVGTTSAAQVVVLSNPGSATLSLTGITVTGANASSFSLTNGCGSTVAAGGSCNLMVTFTPSAAGAQSASISVSDNASGSPQMATLSGTGIAPQASLAPASLAFGSQRVGTSSATQTVVLSNPGSSTLSISSISLTGANASAFSLNNGCGATLAAGASCNLVVTFTPSAAGAQSAAISVSDNAPGSPQMATLSGTGTAPQAVLSPTSLSFGNQTMGTTSAAKVITLSNPGNATLNISSIAVGGMDTNAFASTNTCGSSLAAGGSCSISVTFTPGAVASFAANITVTGDASGSPQSATLSGNGIAVVPADFSVSSPTPPQTIATGGSAAYSIQVASVNGTFEDAVTLSASGLPAGATATFSPAAVTPGAQGASSTLTIQLATVVGKAEAPAPLHPVRGGSLALGFAFAMTLGAGLRRNRRALRALILLVTLACVALALTACGGGFPGTHIAQSYNITVTGTSGSTQHSTTIALTVQ